MVNMYSFKISASGMSAERMRMDVIASNIANADVTRTIEGGPYVRKRVEFETLLDKSYQDNPQWDISKIPNVQGVRVRTVSADTEPFPEVYDPTHPDADQNGYVKKPNVNVVTEMSDMIAATRAYEANVTAFNATKSMFQKALEISS